MKIDKNMRFQHLYLRAGFGISPSGLAEASRLSLEKNVEKLFRQSEKINSLTVVDDNTLAINKQNVKDLQSMSQTERRQQIRDVLKESREKIKNLNVQWLNRMASGESSLREKMTLFWHGHFACQHANAFFVQKQHNLIREKALGKFPDLLFAISKDPAMLAFLNNRQNRKDSPNENFAREVMELFTLGRGNYSESDVKNAAKAFTGWNFNQEGEFVFNQRQHDDGEKKFFGKTGKWEGEDILNMILENKQTAKFLTNKIFRYFVNDTPDEKIIASLADSFYKSGYDIGKLMKEIFMSDWFYDEKNIGNRIKSPVELLAGIQNTFSVQFQDSQGQLFIQKILGQILFYPPNVAGWKEGKNWIDSSSLMFRLQLPDLLFKTAQTYIKAKEDGDINTEFLAKKNGNRFMVSADWKKFENEFKLLKDNELLENMSDYLLQYKLSVAQLKMVQSKADNSSRETLVKSYALALVSLPEYQLC